MTSLRYKSPPTPSSLAHLAQAIRKWIKFIGLLIGVILVCVQQLSAQTDAKQPTPNQVDIQKIKNAISLLGHIDPKIRRNATTELEKFGAAAISELQKAAEFETTLDYETQFNATIILETINASLATEAIDKFVRGKGTLAGWPAFKRYTGDTPESRSFFRDIYGQYRSELEQIMRPSTTTSNTHEHTNDYSQLLTLFQSPKTSQVYFGMFLLAHQLAERNSTPNNADSFPITQSLSKKQLKELLNKLTENTSTLAKVHPKPESIVSLVLAIIETIPKEYPLLKQKLELIQQLNSPKTYPLLLELTAPVNPTVVRSMAIAHAIKIGDQNTFEQFDTYLNDTTVVGQFLVTNQQFDSTEQYGNQIISEVQIRDIVLLGKLRLAGKDHTKFGFNSKAASTPHDKVDLKQAGFANDEDRERAFERYRRTNQ